MQTIAAYAPNDSIKELVQALKSPDVMVRALNPQAHKGDVLPCDRCVIHTATRNAATIQAQYAEHGIPVYAWSPQDGFGDSAARVAVEADTQPQAVQPASPVATDEDLEAATQKLFPKARKQGISKEALREAIRQRGAESVAGELGTAL